MNSQVILPNKLHIFMGRKHALTKVVASLHLYTFSSHKIALGTVYRFSDLRRALGTS